MIALAFARLRRRPGALLWLASLNLALALAATTPLSAPLARALDLRPAASAVADSADDAPRLELLQDHPELAPSALTAALLALVLWSALSWVACGGLLAADDEPFAVACARHARRMITVGATGLPLRLIALLGPLAAWPLLGDTHSLANLTIGVAVGVVISGVLWSLVTVTLDRARGLALSQPQSSAWRIVRAALTASNRQRGATLALAAFSGLGFLTLSAAQVAATHALPPTNSGAALALTIGVIGAIARAATTAITLLAANS